MGIPTAHGGEHVNATEGTIDHDRSRPQEPPATAPGGPDEQLIARMGIEIIDHDRDRLVGTMPVAGNRQPYGLLHGGANAVLAETLGSIAATLHAPPGSVAVGLELSCTHHRAARDGVVTGVCTPLHVGRTTASFEIVMTDDAGRRTCTARLTCVFLDRAPGERSS